jgi:uncharacterized integral membrane protein
MSTKLFSYGIVLILFSIFIIQNAEIVSLRFFFWNVDLPRALMLLSAFVIGTVFGAFLMQFVSKKKKQQK